MLATMALTVVAPVMAQAAESSLLGVKLYSTYKTVLTKFGTPDEVQAVTLGGGGTVGGGAGGRGGAPGGAPGAMGRPGAGGGRPGPAGAPGLPGAGADMELSPFTLDGDFRQGFGGPPPGMGAPPGQGGPGGRMGGPPGMGAPGGPPGGMPGGPGGRMGGGGGAPANAGAGERVTYTRWVYNKSASKYAFIMDRQGRVIQIESIGLTDPRVRTAKGIRFGSSFKSILLAYGPPDGYEIAGDNILVKYLTRQKVAFKLSRLGAKTPQVVTGVVVAAGKS